jgi:hypothetical protein
VIGSAIVISQKNEVKPILRKKASLSKWRNGLMKIKCLALGAKNALKTANTLEASKIL